MKLVFIDETGGVKVPDFYGVCAVAIDTSHYASIATDFIGRIQKTGWQEGLEFKGSFLFSSSKGDVTIAIEERIELVRDLIRLNVAQKNAKVKAAFAWNRGGDDAVNHLRLLRRALTKLLSKAKSKAQGKHLCVVFADENERVDYQDLRHEVRSVIDQRGQQLVEDVVEVRSSYYHVGVCYADLVAYLAAWVCLAGLEGAQRALFEYEEIALTSTDERKVETVSEIFGMLKNVQVVGPKK